MSRGFLLDTNVPSELTKPLPDFRVKAWVATQDNSLFHLSVVSVGELRKGFSLLAPGKRRLQLEEWFEHFLLPLFTNRIMPVTQDIGDRWGALTAQCQLRGTPLNTADGLIAATAIEHNLTIVTRNIDDFASLGADILNPWQV